MTIWSFVLKVLGVGHKIAVMQVSVEGCKTHAYTDYDLVFNFDDLFISQISILLSLS